MKIIIVFLLLAATVVHADDSETDQQCLCGVYHYDYKFPGNSVSQYRLIDGGINPAIVNNTERADNGKYVYTEFLMNWPAGKGTYIPAWDQIANDKDVICMKGKVEHATLKPNFDGVKEELTYFSSVEEVYAKGSRCEGEPIAIDKSVVKKAALPK